MLYFSWKLQSCSFQIFVWTFHMMRCSRLSIFENLYCKIRELLHNYSIMKPKVPKLTIFEYWHVIHSWKAFFKYSILQDTGKVYRRCLNVDFFCHTCFYKHTEAQISKELSICLAYFWPSILYIGPPTFGRKGSYKITPVVSS